MASETGGKSVTESATEATSERMIMLTSSEGQEFLVSEAGARLSSVLAGIVGGGDNITLHNVPAGALDAVVKYCNKHAVAAAANPGDTASSSSSSSSFNAAPPHGNSEQDKWDRELVGGIDVDALYELLIAANFLGLDGLVDTVCEKVADTIKRCETPKQIRAAFNIADDLTAAEKEEIRKQYAWAFYDGDI